MKTIIEFLIVIVLVFLFTPSCSAKQEIVSAPTVEIEPTVEPTSAPENIENTPTPIVYRVGEVIDFVYYDAETKPDIDVAPNEMEERILPVMRENGSWFFESRNGNGIEVKLIEKTDKLNTMHISTLQKEYILKTSRGGIVYFEISAGGWADYFLFSPDIGETGRPIDCVRDARKLFCYYPSSLIQFTVRDGGIFMRLVEEIEGWCVDYQNGPDTHSMNEEATTNTYKLPDEGYYTWTEDNCPFSEITDITQKK